MIVLPNRNGAKVIWIDASAIAAFVVEHQAFWNWPDQFFVKRAMSNLRSRSDAHPTVSIWADVSLPNPASSSINHVLSALRRRSSAEFVVAVSTAKLSLVFAINMIFKCPPAKEAVALAFRFRSSWQ